MNHKKIDFSRLFQPSDLCLHLKCFGKCITFLTKIKNRKVSMIKTDFFLQITQVSLFVSEFAFQQFDLFTSLLK